mmetsp:Transcript_17145/g.38625  ORF Transcript_17145/g.38625 Transcript_17145/m.38625 type:complete len:82 (-) Transcript_17145:61-306(-)
MRGTLADPQTILVKYGPQLNTILQERSNSVVERTKKAADEYVENFLACNEEAVRTESGLVYCSMVEGTGKQPAVTDTVEVQ